MPVDPIIKLFKNNILTQVQIAILGEWIILPSVCRMFVGRVFPGGLIPLGGLPGFGYAGGMRILRFFLLPVMMFSGPGAWAAEDPATKAGFVAHRALYEIDLAATHNGSQVVNVDGQMLYEWQPSCDGWSTTHRFNLFYEYTDSPSTAMTSDYTTFESFDGASLNFATTRKRDGVVFQEIRGHAGEKMGDSSPVRRIVYTEPQSLAYPLPDGVLFPTFHTLELLKKIKENQKFFVSTVFDGSDDQGPMELNAFVGEGVVISDSLKTNTKIDQSLLRAPARKVRLAFFPANAEESEPEYEMSVIFHENGVISDMYIEYDDFSVHQSLKALSVLAGGCSAESLNE